MKNILNIIPIIGWCLIAAPAFSQQSFSLDEAVNYAMKNSNNIKLAQANIAAADAQITEYKATGIPTVSGNGSYSYYFAIPTQIIPDFLGPAVDGRLQQYNLIEPGQVLPPSGQGFPAQFGTKNVLTFGAEANFVLFDAAFFTGLRAITKAKDLAQRQTRQTEFELKQSVTEAYLLLAYLQKNTEYINKNITNLSSNLRELNAMLESGFIESLDVERVELSLQNLEIEKTNTERLLEVYENLLKFQMNYPLAEDIVLEDNMDSLLSRFSLEAGDVDGSYQYASRPEYEAIETGIVLNELRIKSIKAGYYPTLRGFLSASAALQRNDLFDSNDNDWFPTSLGGLALNVPIFDGFRRKGQIQTAKIELEKATIQQRMFEQGMDLEVINARKNLRNAMETSQARSRSLRLAEKIYNTTQVKYTEGVGSSIENTTAEREYYTAQSGYTESLYQLLKAQYELKKALGKI